MTTTPTSATPTVRQGRSLEVSGWLVSCATRNFLSSRTPQQSPCATRGDPMTGAVRPHSMKSKRVAFDIGVTILVIGGLVVGSLSLSHISHGAIRELSARFFFFLSAGFPIMALFALLERVVPAIPHKSISGWILNLRVAILNYFGTALAAVLSASAAAALTRHFGIGWVDLRFSTGRGVMALIAAFLLSLFITDFFYYWCHRFQHKSAILWQQHKLHHMDEQMNASTQWRMDWIKAFFRMLTVTIPATVVFKLDPVPAGTIGGIFAFVLYSWSTFAHSNIKIHLGNASVLFLCPQVHRIHHSRLLEHRDRNFSGSFPIWDLLFGTYYPPARDEFPPTGVDGEGDVQSFVEAVLVSFRGWRKMFREWRGRHDVVAA
jgi:sterol desaturase/sphingolipid hydroxylase (fatty acid hydroxylase superfamily)